MQPRITRFARRHYGIRVILIQLLWLAFILACASPVQASPSAPSRNEIHDHVVSLLEEADDLALEIRRRKPTLSAYYVKDNGELLWIGSGRGPQLIEAVRSAETQGLFSGDYPADYLQELEDAAARTDERSKAVVELLYSAFFLKYADDLKTGRLLPQKVDPQLYWKTKEVDLIRALHGLAAAGDLEGFIGAWEPDIPSYKALKAKLAEYRTFEKNNSWPRIPSGDALKPGMDDPRVPILRERLSGESAAGAEAAVIQSSVYDETLLEAVKHFQIIHGLEPDGIIGFRTLVALNIPIEERVRQIIVSMERWRWMPEDLGQDYIMVNIAGFHLTRFENGIFAERKKVIVGRPYRRTPVFSDAIQYLEFNPYWTVPYSIATQDKLPILSKNPAALTASGFEVFSGERKVDPRAIDWSQYSRQNFPFTLRQKPGPNNALGQVKFMFPNRFNVYLHDTPDRELFEKTSRSFSSGCVRVHEPIKLAEQLLKNKEGWDRTRIDAVLASGERSVVNLDVPMPIHIIYSTAWLAEDGTIRFSVDFYQRDERLYQALFGKPVPWSGS